MTDAEHERIDTFTKAVKLYREKQFTAAKMLFQSITHDAPSQTYISRCDFYIKNPPEDNWNGVWRMTEM